MEWTHAFDIAEHAKTRRIRRMWPDRWGSRSATTYSGEVTVDSLHEYYTYIGKKDVANDDHWSTNLDWIKRWYIPWRLLLGLFGSFEKFIEFGGTSRCFQYLRGWMRAIISFIGHVSMNGFCRLPFTTVVTNSAHPICPLCKIDVRSTSLPQNRQDGFERQSESLTITVLSSQERRDSILSD